MSASRAALRIARRDALRSKGRTALVLAMIGIPVMAIVALSILFRTSEMTKTESLTQDLGRATASVQAWGREPVLQGMEGFSQHGTVSGAWKPWTEAEIREALVERLGPQTRILESGHWGTQVEAEHGVVSSTVSELDLRDPVTRGIVRLDGGRPAGTLDEVAVSDALRDRGYTIGSTLRTKDGKAKKVVGHVTLPDNPKGEFIQALPGAFSASDRGSPIYLVAGGPPVSWADVQALNRLGLKVNSREVFAHPPADSELPSQMTGQNDSASSSEFMIVSMVVALVLLEVTLLAGPAFAVGIRRQRHMLGLIAATGGDARHLRTVVLASGLVLGSAAGVLGTMAGFGGAYVGEVLIEYFGNILLPSWDIPWLWILATVTVAMLSGLAAAYLPARQAARMNVVAALAGRREETRTPRGLPIAGVIMVASGLVFTTLGVPALHEGGAVVGTILLVIGFVFLAPAAVALSGRLAHRLPLPMRLAVRDADRNRGRTAPAVAAILAAVAGMTVLGIGGSSDHEQNRVEYVPRIPMGQTMLAPLPAKRADEVVDAAERSLPGIPVVRADRFQSPAPGLNEGQVLTRLNFVPPENCEVNCMSGTLGQFGHEYLIGGPEVARFILGKDDPSVIAALNAGKVVVFVDDAVRDGRVQFEVDRFGPNSGDFKTLRTLTLPAVFVAAPSAPTALFPPPAAAKAGLEIEPAALLIGTKLTEPQQQSLKESVAKVADYAEVYTEKGFTESFALPLILLAAAGSVLVLGGSLIATGLSAADARPDLATLAAIGAKPRTRRLLLMSQAAFVSLLGCWLGFLAGLTPGIAVAFPLTKQTTDGLPPHGVIIQMPWLLITAVTLGVPLLASLVIGLTARSRLPLTRRTA